MLALLCWLSRRRRPGFVVTEFREQQLWGFSTFLVPFCDSGGRKPIRFAVKRGHLVARGQACRWQPGHAIFQMLDSDQRRTSRVAPNAFRRLVRDGLMPGGILLHPPPGRPP